jgi:hypothetical protein
MGFSFLMLPPFRKSPPTHQELFPIFIIIELIGTIGDMNLLTDTSEYGHKLKHRWC